jgi:hypothetical protein
MRYARVHAQATRGRADHEAAEAVEANESDGLEVRYWFRASNLSGLGHKIIAGLDPGDEAEALRRYKAHLDERDKPKLSEPEYCSFCGQPTSDALGFITGYERSLICATCTEEASAIFAEQRKRR